MKLSNGTEALKVLPESLWRKKLREDERLVSHLHAHGATVLPDGTLVVEADRTFRVALLLREYQLTWRFDPAHAVTTALAESDPVTLMNRMLYDPEHPYSWEDRKELKWYPKAEELEASMDDYKDSIKDYADQKLKKSSGKSLERGWQDPELSSVGEEKEREESNEAGTQSTDPSFNPCPAYMKGFCRVDGRVCLYSKRTYEDCPKYPLAQTITADNMAIPPGTENDETYGSGAFGDQ